MDEHIALLYANSEKGRDGCLVWTGPKTRAGYGNSSFNGKRFYAHRTSYEVHKGEIGKLLVLHKCDNPPCINPNHLFLGTQKDNMMDASRKGRTKPQRDPTWGHGEKNTHAKLSKIVVTEIRNKYGTNRKVSQEVIAQDYGITQAVVSKILLYQIWV